MGTETFDQHLRWHRLQRAALLTTTLAVAGCSAGIDFDLRDVFRSDADTTNASQQRAAPRPTPDDRGVISYPDYQVAVARRADTVRTVAARIGVDADALARFNGRTADDALREGEVLALPTRVPDGTDGLNDPNAVDVTTLAGNAIDQAEAAQTPDTTNLPDTGVAPIRHRVARGETAFTIARLYGISPRDLATWNGLGPNLDLREGQFLLIPVGAPESAVSSGGVSPPGSGSATPTPPSASQPLPEEQTSATSTETAKPPAPDIGATTSVSQSAAAFVYPVSGNIIRAYKKGENDGIDIGASPGTAVVAAQLGTVAAITRDTEQTPIIILRHADGLLTVYANVDGLKVQKGDAVKKGQPIAVVRDTEPGFLHFEVRKGLESTDPISYLE